MIGNITYKLETEGNLKKKWMHASNVDQCHSDHPHIPIWLSTNESMLALNPGIVGLNPILANFLAELWKDLCVVLVLIIPFPHIDAFGRICSRRLLTQCFPLLVIGYPFNYGDFLFFDNICSKSSAAALPYEVRVNWPL